jgi:hypothetical protein
LAAGDEQAAKRRGGHNAGRGKTRRRTMTSTANRAPISK